MAGHLLMDRYAYLRVGCLCQNESYLTEKVFNRKDLDLTRPGPDMTWGAWRWRKHDADVSDCA
jgi:hypothetical protein